MIALSAAVLTTTALAHFLTTGCALMLIRRGPNRRLRLLTLTVGIMSLAQTIMLLYSAGLWQASRIYLAGVHETLMGGLSLLAIHLLAREIYDRRHTDKRLRLVEHETAMAAPDRPVKRALEKPPTTEDLLRLLGAIEAHAEQARQAAAARGDRP